ncbi:MAG TPA: PQQ-binding-like beta-propeller repeat protein [Usitatibacter sp.]
MISRLIALFLVLAPIASLGSAPWIAGVRFTVATEGPIRSTPAVRAGRVYFGSSDGKLYAVDAKTGERRWSFRTQGAVASSPAIDAERVYFTSRDGSLYAVNANTGRLAWRYRFGANLGPYNFWDYRLSSPVLASGAVLVGGGDGTVVSLDARSGKLRWRFDAQSRVRSTPAVSGGFVVFGTHSGYVIALDQQTGKESWRFATAGVGHTFEEGANDATSIVASATIVGERVFIGSRDSYIYALELASGKLLWRTTHDESSWILSTASDGERLYVGSGSAQIVQAADLATGKELWRTGTSGAVFSSIALSGDTLLASDFSGNAFALDRRTGEILWRFPLAGRSFATPVESEGIVYCASDTGVLYALDVAPSPSAANTKARRIVYTAGKKTPQSFSWIQNGMDAAIAAQLRGAGYEAFDTPKLVDFLRGYHSGDARAVVVMADNRMPIELLAEIDGVPLMRRFLDAGGKVALLGPNPAAFVADPDTDQVTGVDYSIPKRIFDTPYAPLHEIGGYYAAAPTPDGRRMGLRSAFVGYPALADQRGVTALALDEFGNASAWLRGYGGPPGTGLMQIPIPRQELSSLAEVQAAMEYGITW